MKIPFNKRLWVFILVTLQVSTGLSAPIGIARVGDFSKKAEVAYPYLEKRLQRWLENSGHQEITAQPVNVSVSTEDLLIEQNALKLSHAVENLLVEIYSGTKEASSKSLLEAVEKARQRVNLLSRFGPLLQRSYLVESAYHWKTGETEKAKIKIGLAYKLHPEGSVQSLFEWDTKNAGSFPMEVFETFVGRYITSKTRACQLQVSILPDKATVFVNGFNFGQKRKFSFVNGGLYAVTGDAQGFEQDEVLLHCQRQGIQNLKLQLKPKSLDSRTGLSNLEKKVGVRSVFFIESNDTRFNLYLYTPKIAVDQIPLDSSLSIAEVLEHPTATSFPVAGGKVREIFRKHQISHSLSLKLDPFPHPQPLPRNETNEYVSSPKWYNHWAIWAIAGGIATGVAITYFASRGSSSIGSQSPRGEEN